MDRELGEHLAESEVRKEKEEADREGEEGRVHWCEVSVTWKLSPVICQQSERTDQYAPCP